MQHECRSHEMALSRFARHRPCELSCYGSRPWATRILEADDKEKVLIEELQNATLRVPPSDERQALIAQLERSVAEQRAQHASTVQSLMAGAGLHPNRRLTHLQVVRNDNGKGR